MPSAYDWPCKPGFLDVQRLASPYMTRGCRAEVRSYPGILHRSIETRLNAAYVAAVMGSYRQQHCTPARV